MTLCHAWVAVATVDTAAAAAGRPSFYESLHATYNAFISTNTEESRNELTHSAKSKSPGDSIQLGLADDRSASSSLSIARQESAREACSIQPSPTSTSLDNSKNRRSEPRTLVATRAKWKEIARLVVEFDNHLQNVRAQTTKTRDNDEYSILSKAIARQNGISGSMDPNFNPYSTTGGPGSFEYIACWEYLRNVEDFWKLFRSNEVYKSRRVTGAKTGKAAVNDTETENTNSVKGNNETDESNGGLNTSTVGSHRDVPQLQPPERSSRGARSRPRTGSIGARSVGKRGRTICDAVDALSGSPIDIERVVSLRHAKRTRSRQQCSNSDSSDERALLEATEHLRVISEQSAKRIELLEESNAIALFSLHELRHSAAAKEYCDMAAQFHLHKMKRKLNNLMTQENAP